MNPKPLRLRADLPNSKTKLKHAPRWFEKCRRHRVPKHSDSTPKQHNPLQLLLPTLQDLKTQNNTQSLPKHPHEQHPARTLVRNLTVLHRVGPPKTIQTALPKIEQRGAPSAHPVLHALQAQPRTVQPLP